MAISNDPPGYIWKYSCAHTKLVVTILEELIEYLILHYTDCYVSSHQTNSYNLKK